MSDIIVKIKKNCLACILVIERLRAWGLNYKTVESDESVPRVSIGESELPETGIIRTIKSSSRPLVIVKNLSKSYSHATTGGRLA